MDFSYILFTYSNLISTNLICPISSTPIKYGLSLDMEDKCSAIPPALARLCGVPPSNLVLVDIVQSQVGQILAPGS